jgi:hypothetical protein
MKIFLLDLKSQTEELINNKFAESDQERFYLNEKGYAVADEIIAKYF